MNIRRNIAVFGILLTANLGWTPTASADEYFNYVSPDPSVPAHCADVRIEYFETLSQELFFGIEGSKSRGFTDEIPITRSEASDLWALLKPGSEVGTVPASLQDFYDALIESGQTTNLDFAKEGDILEALSRQALEEQYPAAEYYVTGGVEYHQSSGRSAGRTLGELDLIIARRSDCQVMVIGEAKLGVKQLSHAHAQIARFEAFARSKICSSSNQDAAICH